MRRRSRYGWQWMHWYQNDGTPRSSAPRRPAWDIRCEEAPCRRVHGRRSARRRRRRRRTRAGGFHR